MTKLPAVPPPTYLTKTLPLDCIVANPNNPRKTFNEEQLKELAASISAVGILQAPAVRPLKQGPAGVPDKFVLIWGDRRTRAARLVGLKEIEVKLYDVGDAKAAELALIENDEREDLTPLERAQGYYELHKKHGLSVEQVAAQVQKGKKSRSAIYSLMNLVHLCEAGKKAMAATDEEARLEPSCAELIAQLPPEYHDEVLAKAMGTFEKEWRYNTGNKLSFRALKELVHDEYLLKIKGAPFDVEDAKLVEAAGACSACPKRTGLQPGLFDEKTPQQLCKDRVCYSSKIAAHKRAVVAKAKEEEKPVLSATESKSALSSGWQSGWVKLSDKTSYEKSAGTWGDALKGTELEPQLAVGDRGQLVKVAKKEDVRAALKKKGSKLAETHTLTERQSYGSKPQTMEEKKKAEKAAAERAAAEALHDKVALVAIGKVVDHVETKGLTGELLRLVVGQIANGGGLSEAFRRRGIKTSGHYAAASDFDKHFGRAKDKELLGLLVEIADVDGYGTDGEYPEYLASVCEAAGVKLSKLEEELAPKPEPTAKKPAGAEKKKSAKKKGGGKPSKAVKKGGGKK